jgi:predicted phosphodiesterase
LTSLIVSDLHLGAASRVDVLRRPELRAPLLEAVAKVDELVLLGDALELRQRAVHHVLDDARDFFAELAEAVRGKRVVISAGNHDHQLVSPWIERRRVESPEHALDLENTIAPEAASPVAAQIAGWLDGAEVVVSYPGVWVRDDVYATHGHYIDCHTTLPAYERVCAGFFGRIVGSPPALGSRPDDYEAVLAPLYGLIYQVAQRLDGDRGGAIGGATGRLWYTLSREGPRPLRTRALGAALPVAVAALNRFGLGPLRAQLSGAEVRRASLQALGALARALDVGAAHVVFGHTHRAGPLARDDVLEWRTPNGALVHNSGNWVYESHFVEGATGVSPYWPGGAVVVEAEGPPRLERLLSDRDHEQLRPSALRAAIAGARMERA